LMLVAGRINIDTVIELDVPLRLGGKALARRVMKFFGGSGLNAAVAAKRLDPSSRVELVACVGNDWEGREVLEFLKSEGVSTSSITVLEGSTGRAFVLIDPSGESTSVTLPGVNSCCIAANHVRFAKPSCSVIMNPSAEVFEVVAEVSRKVLTVCDFGTETPRLLNMMKRCAGEQWVYTPSIHEIGSLERAEDIARDCGIRVIVKLGGSRGALLIDPNRGEKVLIPGLSPRDLGLEPRSTSGCGDVFTATLAVELRRGMDIVDAIARAVVSAAVKASRLEPFAAPTRKELEEFFSLAKDRIYGRIEVKPLRSR